MIKKFMTGGGSNLENNAYSDQV